MNDETQTDAPIDLSSAIALDQERRRSAELEEELERLRKSEAFRVGHALVTMLRGFRLGRRREQRQLPEPAGETQPVIAGTAAVIDAAEAPMPGRVLLVALPGAQARIGDHLEQLDQMLVSFEPIYLGDSAALDGYDGPLLTLEHLVPLEEWSKHRPALEWGQYVSQRITTVIEEYSPRTIVMLPKSGTIEMSDLTSVLAPVVLPGMAESETNLLL